MSAFAAGSIHTDRAASDPSIMKLTAGPGAPIHRFGPFVADAAAGRLYYGVDDVPLTPKCFKVLMVLVRLQGQLVSRDELFHQVWPDTFVEPNNLARNISMIRKALHERDPDTEYIVTVSGRGYRFVASVCEVSRDLPRASAVE